MSPTDHDNDKSPHDISRAVAERLLAYEQARAAGRHLDRPPMVEADPLDRLGANLACVDLLHRVPGGGRGGVRFIEPEKGDIEPREAEVDAERIGCLGVSLGGWRTLFLAGLDDRIAAACVVGFMSTVQPMIERHIDTHSFAHFVPGLHQHLDLPDVVALRAPLPLLVQQCRQDGLFPVQGMEDSLTKIGAIYQKAGAKEKFSGRFYDVPHRFDVAMQNDAFTWLDRQLKPS